MPHDKIPVLALIAGMAFPPRLTENDIARVHKILPTHGVGKKGWAREGPLARCPFPKYTGQLCSRIKTAGRRHEAMRDYLTLSLGIHTEIDLRNPTECFGMTGSPAGGRMKWFRCTSFAYADMVSEPGKEAFGKVFKEFLEEKNYPILFHCIAGQDRTGAVAFLLNALLGVEEEELYLDWEVTGFWNANHAFNHKERFSQLIRVFREIPGKNYTEKAEAYVKSIGFSDADIAHFRSLMLEP